MGGLVVKDRKPRDTMNDGNSGDGTSSSLLSGGNSKAPKIMDSRPGGSEPMGGLVVKDRKPRDTMNDGNSGDGTSSSLLSGGNSKAPKIMDSRPGGSELWAVSW